MQRLPDITVTAHNCVLFVVVTMFWIHRTKPANVSLSVANSVLIPLRIALIHVIIFGLLFPFPGLAALVIPFIAVASLCVLPLATIDLIPGGTASAYSVGKMLLIPVYMVRQFAIGFPDRDLLMNRQPSARPGEEPAVPFWIDDD